MAGASTAPPLGMARVASAAGPASAEDIPPVVAAPTSSVLTRCDPQIPRYTWEEWEAAHGDKVPDHPAVFIGNLTQQVPEFSDLDVFLAAYGDLKVTALPEYAQPGGHLAFLDVHIQNQFESTMRRLTETWNQTHLYYNDFGRGPLAKKLSAACRAPRLFEAERTISTNTLIGGPESGLPFHKHTKTWQGLAAGRKAWYVMPPGTMTEAMHDATGPYVFPVRGFHRKMQGLPVGQRPLYCEQRPGEIMYIPDSWWHATLNLDTFQVAYGEKPCCKTQQNGSQALGSLQALFPLQGHWDAVQEQSAGWAEPMPYSILGQVEKVKQSCNNASGSPLDALEDPLRRLTLASQEENNTALIETAAFAHCILAKKVEIIREREGCPNLAVGEVAKKWREAAAGLSPRVAEAECTAL